MSPLDERVAIAMGLEVVVLGNDEVLVRHGTRSQPSELLRDSDLQGALGVVFGRLLSGPCRLADLVDGLSDVSRHEVVALVEDLSTRGILCNPQSHPVQQYLQYTLDGVTALQGSAVTVIGLGPIGARVAVSLDRSGVGTLTLVDDRCTDDGWWSAAPSGARGRGSTRTAQEVVRALLLADGAGNAHGGTGGFGAAGLDASLAGADLAIVAVEQPSLTLGHLVNRLCLRRRIPWLLVGIDGNLGIVGPLFLPGETGCFNEFQVLSEATLRTRGTADAYRRHVLSRGVGSFFPGLPAYADVLAGYAGAAALQMLTTGTSFALGRAVVIDFEDMRIDTENMLRLPRCPVCAHDRIAPAPFGLTSVQLSSTTPSV